MSAHGIPEIRLAHPDELLAISTVLARAFARDPAMSWWGCVSSRVGEDLDSPTAADAKTIEKLRVFQHATLKMVQDIGGIITVAVVSDTIVAACMWLKPGQPFDFPVRTLLRAGAWKVALNWGITGMKRLFIEFTPHVEHALVEAFAKRGLQRLDSWHLLEIGVDPAWEGKGFCGMLMRYGFAFCAPKPVHLEASTAKSRDIYAKYGFEIDDVARFGVGATDSHGVTAKGDKATGYPEWIMTKWKS